MAISGVHSPSFASYHFHYAWFSCEEFSKTLCSIARRDAKRDEDLLSLSSTTTMPPAATKPSTQRKRNRKRKRRAASSSESDSSSSSDSSSEDEAPATSSKLISTVKAPSPAKVESASSGSSSSSESSSSESEDERPRKTIASRGRADEKAAASAVAPKVTRRLSPSPSPPPVALPSFLPSGEDAEESVVQEKELKDRFRQFWMSSVADGFRNDLEEIRKEPNLGTSRLALLIDSLASGAEVFTSTSSNTDINEMDVVLN
ncbi:hypothetical protein D9619_012696 [Psilocybe cf. subviscida]|uniref:Ribosome assembly protein 3 n=1 Tax=Psilocybe cf. subviscida TaxID=2480587 RepID=A0A8H5AQX3_9AGAR|nr:hypothetical protein D9619_012696 [Psilocybe cf. subviscida]